MLRRHHARAAQAVPDARVHAGRARGRPVPRTPSRFLLEIPDELLEVLDIAEEARKQVPKDEVRDFFASFKMEE